MANQIGADKAARDSQFELLRILAMLMIVASHAAQHSLAGGWSLLVQPMGVNTAATYLMGTYGQLGVCLFVIISSWFLCGKSGIRAEKIVRLYVQTMLCSLAIFALVKIGGFEPVGRKELAKALLTPAWGGYWFIRTYLLFYIIVPFLQQYVQGTDERTHGRLALVLVAVIPTLHFFFPTGGEFGLVGDFVCIFVAVSYLKRREGNFLERHCIAVFAGLLALMQTSLFAVHFLCGKFGIGAELEKRILLHIYASRHIFVMTLAMSLFYVFKRYVRIGQSRLINAIAGTTFGVYILHENPLFHAYGENGLSETALLFEQWLHVGAHFEGDAFYPLYFAACVLGVFAVCSAVEFLRQILCRAVERAVRKLRRK